MPKMWLRYLGKQKTYMTHTLAQFNKETMAEFKKFAHTETCDMQRYETSEVERENMIKEEGIVCFCQLNAIKSFILSRQTALLKLVVEEIQKKITIPVIKDIMILGGATFTNEEIGYNKALQDLAQSIREGIEEYEKL